MLFIPLIFTFFVREGFIYCYCSFGELPLVHLMNYPYGKCFGKVILGHKITLPKYFLAKTDC